MEKAKCRYNAPVFKAFDGRKVDIKRFQWLGVRLLYEVNGDARYISSKRRRIKSRDSNATNFGTQDLLAPPSLARRNPVRSAANLFHLRIYEASNPPHFDEKSVDVLHM